MGHIEVSVYAFIDLKFMIRLFLWGKRISEKPFSACWYNYSDGFEDAGALTRLASALVCSLYLLRLFIN